MVASVLSLATTRRVPSRRLWESPESCSSMPTSTTYASTSPGAAKNTGVSRGVMNTSGDIAKLKTDARLLADSRLLTGLCNRRGSVADEDIERRVDASSETLSTDTSRWFSAPTAVTCPSKNSVWVCTERDFHTSMLAIVAVTAVPTSTSDKSCVEQTANSKQQTANSKQQTANSNLVRTPQSKFDRAHARKTHQIKEHVFASSVADSKARQFAWGKLPDGLLHVAVHFHDVAVANALRRHLDCQAGAGRRR